MKKNILSHAAMMMAFAPGYRRPQLCLDYDPVTSAQACDPNVGGLQSGILFNTRSRITAYPAQITKVTAKDLGVLDGAYTTALGEEFQSLQLDHEVSDVKIEGNSAGMGPFKVTAKIFVRGSKDEVEGFAAQAQYDEMVFVLPQSDGVRRVVGNAQFPARVKGMFDSKTVTATDPRGWEFEVTSYSIYPERLKSTATVPVL